jgi:hypothetical protein
MSDAQLLMIAATAGKTGCSQRPARESVMCVDAVLPVPSHEACQLLADSNLQAYNACALCAAAAVPAAELCCRGQVCVEQSTSLSWPSVCE